MFSLDFFLSIDVAEIEKQTRDSLERNFKNALSHDWIPRNKAKKFSIERILCGIEMDSYSERSYTKYQN